MSFRLPTFATMLGTKKFMTRAGTPAKDMMLSRARLPMTDLK